MRRSVLGGALALAILSTLAAACTYSPKFEDGTLSCSTQNNSCPKGYECGSDFKCYATGGPGPGATPSVDNFPGHWIFQAGSMRKISCSDGSVDSQSVKDDYTDIDSTGGTSLIANYYCDWQLDIDDNLTKTSLSLVGQSCTTMSSNGTKFIWHGQEFVFETTDGHDGTLNAKVTSEYTTKDLKVGTCTLELTGTLVNAGPV
jgi:hypothetical protein